MKGFKSFSAATNKSPVIPSIVIPTTKVTESPKTAPAAIKRKKVPSYIKTESSTSLMQSILNSSPKSFSGKDLIPSPDKLNQTVLTQELDFISFEPLSLNLDFSLGPKATPSPKSSSSSISLTDPLLSYRMTPQTPVEEEAVKKFRSSTFAFLEQPPPEMHMPSLSRRASKASSNERRASISSFASSITASPSPKEPLRRKSSIKVLTSRIASAVRGRKSQPEPSRVAVSEAELDRKIGKMQDFEELLRNSETIKITNSTPFDRVEEDE